MLILYTKNNCQYCEKVKNVFLEKNLGYEERNIENDEFIEEVRSKGFRTVPVLVDTTANVTLPSSDQIIDYIQEYSF
jgi:glutaredoxin